MSDILEAAFSYIGQGFKVFPVKTDKKPLTAHGLKDATQTQSGVREFWTRWPDAGIAMVTDGLMVLDFDAKNGGLESKAVMEAEGVSIGYTAIPTVPTPEIPLHSPDTRAWTFEPTAATSWHLHVHTKVVEGTKSWTTAK
jgi:hypothetical protein